MSDEHNMKPKRFDPRAMEALQRYRWRGNIRELRNTVERVLIMTPGDVVRIEDLPQDVRGDVPVMAQAEPATVPLSCPRARVGAIGRNPSRIQGRRRTSVSRAEASREQLEHLQDGRSDRHATQQSLQETRADVDQAGSGRIAVHISQFSLLRSCSGSCSKSVNTHLNTNHEQARTRRTYAIIGMSQSARRPLLDSPLRGSLAGSRRPQGLRNKPVAGAFQASGAHESLPERTAKRWVEEESPTPMGSAP